MVDDKDESAPDPWAGIDDDAGGQPAEGFTFSFDSVSEVTDAAAPFPADEPVQSPFPASGADDAPVIPIENLADTGGDADPFAALSTEAEDGAAADIADWLTEPAAEAGGEPSLAVFPPHDADEGSQPAASGDPFSDLRAEQAISEGPASDNLHDEAQAATPVGSSHVEVGTGFSGIASPSEIDSADGFGATEEWAEAMSPDAISIEALDSGVGAREATLDDFSTDDQPSFDASGFDGVSDAGDAAEALEPQPAGEAIGLATAAAAATVAAASPRPSGRKQGGGIGQILGIVLGGVMAIPITYAILIWGFQRDPFKLAGLVPEQVAFLLPQKLQPGYKKPGGPKLDATSALDNLPAVPEESEPVSEPEPEAEPAAVKPSADAASDAIAGDSSPANVPEGTPIEPQEPLPDEPPLPSADLTAALKPAPEPLAPPEPEPLDLTALEAAVADASAALETLAGVEPDAQDRKRLLVAWYKRLAAVAEQVVLVEKTAADSGRGFDEAVKAIDPLAAAIAADPTIQQDLVKLSGMWLGSKKRPADGAVLLATFDGARQVGPYWSMRVTIDGAEPRAVAVISRTEPQVEPGQQVLVTGVLFDGDVVWATDCRPLAAKAVPVEDLF